MSAMAEDGEEEQASAYEKALDNARKERAAEMQRRETLKQLLEPAAYERLANIRAASPQMYQQLAQLVIYLYQNGQLRGKLSEEALQQLIGKIVSNRRETKITRISK
ncbi:DNA-binding protein [Candidatus Norongarragalina meridionalis]|nr:DNA-binding protein [Candidatus Norongarragalina meridionalis]